MKVVRRWHLIWSPGPPPPKTLGKKVEKKPAIGGVMSQLDKTFPTNDCPRCIISPKLVECGRHLNIEISTITEV